VETVPQTSVYDILYTQKSTLPKITQIYGGAAAPSASLDPPLGCAHNTRNS